MGKKNRGKVTVIRALIVPLEEGFYMLNNVGWSWNFSKEHSKAQMLHAKAIETYVQLLAMCKGTLRGQQNLGCHFLLRSRMKKKKTRAKQLCVCGLNP